MLISSIISCLFICFAASVFASSSSLKKPQENSRLGFFRIQGSFKIKQQKDDASVKMTITLSPVKNDSSSVLLTLSTPENTLSVNQGSTVDKNWAFYKLTLDRLSNSNTETTAFTPLFSAQNSNSESVNQGTLILVMHSNNGNFNVMESFTFSPSKYMGTCARNAVEAFKSKNELSNITFGFFLVNPVDSQLESPVWATVLILVILIFDLVFIISFSFWCYWIKQAKKLKSDK